MISVIIPSYNRERTIHRAVESVLNQTYSDLECIVVDDCSTDRTADVIQSIADPRLKYIKLEKNSGACVARNVGIEAAQGEYIAFQDSDDEFLPEKLQRQLDALIEKNADVVFCAMNRIGYSKADGIFPKMQKGFKSHHEIAVGFYISTQMIMGKREVFEEYQFDPKMPRMQDYDLMVRVARTKGIYFLDEPLVNVYLQEDSITPVKKNYRKMREVTEILMSKYADMAKEYTDWNLIMLNRIAFCKTVMGENATDIYGDICNAQPTVANSLKWVLSKLHLLRLFYKIKE